MKIRINREILAALKPCNPSWEHYLKHYADFDGDILEFLALNKITPQDKIWVSARVMPRFLVEVFAIDCAVAAAANTTAAAAAAAASAVARAAASAAYAADYAAANTAAANTAAAAAYAYAAERERQLDAIAYLVSTWEEQGE